MTRPLFLFTDFGVTGPYVGQMRAALSKAGLVDGVIDLMADAPSFDPKAAAYLLAALLPYTADDAVVLGVVDPGVGSRRGTLIVKADDRFLVGPDNGLFAVVVKRASRWCAWTITWRPERLSHTFHGRDLFAPVAAALAKGEPPDSMGTPQPLIIGQDWPGDVAEIIYVDHYGNAITGLRGERLTPETLLTIGNWRLGGARTFSDVVPGQAFWYVNSIGMVEISVSNGSASGVLGLKVGDSVG
ncbi:MAG: SAM-dependent chlorinase/fluorinase [Magnetospirillum sp.]|nr:SAM-dependent chlorinase/fluorinase [Magnetospirillum sp.]